MTSALDLLMDSDSTAETTTLLESNGICTIDSRTRTIFVPPEIIVGAVQSDKNAERIKFSCPKIVGDNLDLSKFSIRINFENVSIVDPDISIKDQYICEDASINGDNITFSWVIGKNAARYMGTTRFIVCAVKTDSDSNISIEWNTTVAQIPVLEGIEIDQPSLDENNKDVINQLLAITKTASDEAVKNVNSAKEQAITEIQNVLQPDKTLTVEGGIADAKATGNAISSLREDLEGIAKKHVNLLENLQFYPGEFYTYESHNVSENSDFGRFELFNINANENYYFIDIFSNFSCVKYDDGSYSRIENTTTGFVSGIFKPTQNGVVAITGVRSSSSKNTLFTSSKEMYENKIYESYLSFSEKASDEVRKIMDYLPKTYYVEKDESGDFVKLSDAIVTATKYMDSVVYLGDGTWDLIEEFGSDFFNNATGGGAPRSPVRGLLLKNRIHIIGSSKSKIICNYTGDNAVIKKWFSVFNSDIYGFTLENITIEASNIRYIIHDERDSDTDSYINRYINCHFKFDNSDNDTPGRTAQCIGGGLGIDGYIDINGGVFESIDTTKTGHICVVSYHNSAGANAKNHISIKNTYLKALGYFRINSYGESTEITECEITNCSMGRSVLIGHETGGSNMNINVTQWNNEIR